MTPLSTTLTPWIIPGTSLDLFGLLALVGVVLWTAALVLLVGSDMAHSAQRHGMHLPHHRPGHHGRDRSRR